MQKELHRHVRKSTTLITVSSEAQGWLMEDYPCSESNCEKVFKTRKARDTHHASVHVGRRSTLFQLCFI